MYPTSPESSPRFREILLDPGETPATVPSRRARMPHFFSMPESADPSSILSRLRVACLGVGAVGITQLMIWGVVMGAAIMLGLTAGASALADVGIDLSSVRVPLGVVALILVFLILGYLLYAGMFAGGGATMGSEQDAQQVALPIIMLIIVPFVAAQPLIESPNAVWAVVMSLVPFFSPILMPSRLLVSSVPAVQVTAAVLLLVACLLGVAWVAGRIYRVGILMRGQRANLPEIIRWVRHG